MRKRDLEGSSAASLARELIKDAAASVRDGNCVQAIESLDAAAVYIGAAGASSDRPMRIRRSQLGREHGAVMKKILVGCIRPRIVR